MNENFKSVGNNKLIVQRFQVTVFGEKRNLIGELSQSEGENGIGRLNSFAQLHSGNFIIKAKAR